MSETIELQPVPLTLTGNPSQPRNSLGSYATDDELSVPSPSDPKAISSLRLTLTILQPSLINFLASFTNGTITIALPVIARSISLPRSLYLWPSSVNGLTSGAMLLIAGAVADIAGARPVELAGIFLLGVFTLACGLSNTGEQLVVFRALQGIALAMHLPASVALIASAVPKGRTRNIGFGCLGLSQPLGFSVGLVLSGIMVERIGWRSGFYISGGGMLVAALTAVWTLPKVKPENQNPNKIGLWKRLCTEIDWVGGIIASGGLAMLAYVLATLSGGLSTIHSATAVTLLSLSIVLLLAFPFWMHYRTSTGKPALVPNALWKNMPFTSTCIMAVLSNGMVNSMELFSSLYFQEIQDYSPLTTSLCLLPSLIVGVLLNLTVGLFVDRVPARWLVTCSSLLCALAPLMMALVNPAWSYWYLELWAQIFAPLSADVLFTVGLIIVSDSFPEKTQALAGAVFNTVAQFGMSLGIGLCQLVTLGVTSARAGNEGDGGNAELGGYRASFWTMFAYMAGCSLIAVVGLQKVGKVGLKRE